MIWIILFSASIGLLVGAAIVILAKVGQNWSNTELDGTMFIAIILIAFCATILGTYLKDSFAMLETTKMALDIFENIFMIIAGYLFKKANDIVKGAKP